MLRAKFARYGARLKCRPNWKRTWPTFFVTSLSPADHTARMDRRIGAKDFGAAMRAAKRLGPPAIAERDVALREIGREDVPVEGALEIVQPRDSTRDMPSRRREQGRLTGEGSYDDLLERHSAFRAMVSAAAAL